MKPFTFKPSHYQKLDNHIAAVSLHFMHYNFVRIHQTQGDARDGDWRHESPLGDQAIS
jgi:hypothetical protein